MKKWAWVIVLGGLGVPGALQAIDSAAIVRRVRPRDFGGISPAEAARAASAFPGGITRQEAERAREAFLSKRD